MSYTLTRLHAQMLATQELGWPAEIRAGAEAAYRAYAVKVAAGLPFPHSLVRVERTDYTSMPPVVHIVPAEDIAIGKLRRTVQAAAALRRRTRRPVPRRGGGELLRLLGDRRTALDRGVSGIVGR